jgi:hypothetical protein
MRMFRKLTTSPWSWSTMCPAGLWPYKLAFANLLLASRSFQSALLISY